MRHVTLEICVEDAAGLNAAIDGGADRIELCSALSIGGLTPSAGLMALAGRMSVPSYAMIRPRGGDFVFSPDEIDMMRADIDTARAAGLAGVVLGVSRPDGTLDAAALRLLVDHAASLGLTLHRAFDLVPDPLEAIDLAVSLGFERILTSGCARTVPEGLDRLETICAHAGNRLSIMPGSGVTIGTIDAILARLPVHEVHSSCSSPAQAQEPKVIALGFGSPSDRRTDIDKVRALKARLGDSF